MDVSCLEVKKGNLVINIVAALQCQLLEVIQKLSKVLGEKQKSNNNNIIVPCYYCSVNAGTIIAVKGRNETKPKSHLSTPCCYLVSYS